MSTSVVKGSKAWLEGICEALFSSLVGIEMCDDRGGFVTPQVQVRFIIERYPDTPTLGVSYAAKFEGYRGVYPIHRGNDNLLFYFVAFDFNDGNNIPSVEDLMDVSKANNFLFAPEDLNFPGYFSRLSDALRG